jgi:nucleolar protein 15
MANMMDDDRHVDAEDSSTDDEQEKETLSLPSVVGSGKRKLKKSEMKRNKLIPIQPGLIRLSGLPYGFFERELYSYFSQFGNVSRLKLIRSKKTGGSRGYAYIEFEDEDVARIASETMHGYLMFRALIKSRLMDRNKIDTDKLFQNWKRIFSVKTPRQKRVSYNRIKSNEQADKSNQRRAKKLLKQQEKLAAAGIKYDLTDFIPLKAIKEKEKSTTTKTTEKTPNKSTKKKAVKS